MNNLTFGGFAARRDGRAFTYYETIAGGCGASAAHDGPSAAHSHMTNSWNTPVEVFEETYPVRVKRYAIRRGSGGRGKNRGGEGIIRELEFLTALEGGLLSDRRITAPYGLYGGQSGAAGKNTLVRHNLERTLGGKCSFELEPGDVLRIETPGGGGWGIPQASEIPGGRRRKRSR